MTADPSSPAEMFAQLAPASVDTNMFPPAVPAYMKLFTCPGRVVFEFGAPNASARAGVESSGTPNGLPVLVFAANQVAPLSKLLNTRPASDETSNPFPVSDR